MSCVKAKCVLSQVLCHMTVEKNDVPKVLCHPYCTQYNILVGIEFLAFYEAILIPLTLTMQFRQRRSRKHCASQPLRH